MSLNEVPGANRVQIGFFGRTNVGKSSLVNAITNQEMSIVSEEKGTTTDPVRKSMELLPIGPVIIIDTPGLADETVLGKKREKKTKELLQTIDIAVLVIDGTVGITTLDENLIKMFQEKKKPYLIACNKMDLMQEKEKKDILSVEKENVIFVSALNGDYIYECKEKIGQIVTERKEKEKYIIADRLDFDDTVILVIPIDKGAPKGRLILPQQQVIRELLEAGVTCVVVRETELKNAFDKLEKLPKLVITDSQAFHKVAPLVPQNVMLTSFSILFANYKGNLKQAYEGAKNLDCLPEGAPILISEGCTHHRQCDDIGSVKLPKWIEEYTGKKFEYSFSSGREFPENLNKYQLVIHCGGCMLGEQEMKYRYEKAKQQNTPITNYGIIISYMRGILEKSLEIFEDDLKN